MSRNRRRSPKNRKPNVSTVPIADSIRIPKWAVSIIVLLVGNIIVGGFAAGKIVQRVEQVERSLSEVNVRMEDLQKQIWEYLRHQ